MKYNSWKILLCAMPTIGGFFIRRAQLRLGYTKEEAKWTHVTIYNEETCTLYESVASGVVKSHINKYIAKGIPTYLLDIKEPPEDIHKRCIDHMYENNNNEQTEYDYSLIFGLFLFSIGFPKKIINYFNNKNKDICTEYVSQVLKLKIFCPAEYYKKFK